MKRNVILVSSTRALTTLIAGVLIGVELHIWWPIIKGAFQ